MNIVTVVPGIEGEFELKTGCINWQSSKLGNGYGSPVWIDGKTVLVLESKIAGFLDSGYFGCHTSDNRNCINPAHLVAGSAAENTGQTIDRDCQTPRRKSISGSGKLSILSEGCAKKQLRKSQTKYLSETVKNHLAKEYGVENETITKILQTNIPDKLTTVSPRFVIGEIQGKGCIISQATKEGADYGTYFKKGKLKLITRAILAEKLGGEIPASIEACQSDNFPCINPEHLWLGTRSQNALDASKKVRSQGKSHPLSNAKLDGKQVRESRQKLAVGERMKDVAEAYSVGRPTIHDIKYHVTWKQEGEGIPIPPIGGFRASKLTWTQVQDVRD